MRAFTFPLKDFINKGLARNNNKRNNPMLVKSTGTIPYEGVLEAIEEFTRIDTSAFSGVVFPYPQLFTLSEFILVCTESAIYEYDGSTLTLKLFNLPVGTTWSIVDFKSFLYLVNGDCAITRDSQSGEYGRVFSDTDNVPYGNCVGDYNGQLLLGNPIESDSTASGGGCIKYTLSTYTLFANHTAADANKIVLVDLSTFVEDRIITMTDQWFAESLVTDCGSNYGYVGTRRVNGGATPSADITKINLNSFTEEDVLNITGEATVTRIITDSSDTFMYATTATTNPGKVHKIRLSDFTVVDTLQLQSLEYVLTAMTIDRNNEFLYVGSGSGLSNFTVKIRLSDFSRNASYTNATLGNSIFSSAYIDPTNTYLYMLIFSSGLSNTSIIQRIDLSNFGSAATLLNITGGDTHLPVQMIVDETNDMGYYSKSNGDLQKIDLDNFVSIGSIAVGTGSLGFLAIDTQEEFIYAGDNNGDIHKVDIDTFTKITPSITPSITTDFYDNGFKAHGAITN